MRIHHCLRNAACAAVLVASALPAAASAEIRIVKALGDVSLREDGAQPVEAGDLVAPGTRIVSGAQSSFVVDENGSELNFGAHDTYVSPGVPERPLTWSNALSRFLDVLLGKMPGTPVPVYAAVIIGALLMGGWFFVRAKADRRKVRPTYHWG